MAPPADFDCYRSKRIIVTGAAGFVGMHLVNSLLRLGADVHAWIRPDQPKSRPLAGDAQLQSVDLAEPDQVREAFSKTEASHIFHLAAIGADGRSYSSQDFTQQNIQPTFQLFNLSSSTHAKFITTGTMFELKSSPDPQNEEVPFGDYSDYARSKIAALRHLESLPEKNWLWLRIFGVYGPWEAKWRIFPYVLRKILQHKPAELGSCQIVRDFIHVDDVVDALLRAGLSSVNGEVFNIGSGTGYHLRSILETYASSQEALDLLEFGKKPDRSQEIQSLIADRSKAQRALGWEPKVELIQGLSAYENWCKTDEAENFLSNKP